MKIYRVSMNSFFFRKELFLKHVEGPVRVANQAWRSLSRIFRREKRSTTRRRRRRDNDLMLPVQESVLVGMAFLNFHQNYKYIPSRDLALRYCHLIQSTCALGKWASLIGWSLSEGLVDWLVRGRDPKTDRLRSELENARKVAFSRHQCRREHY